MRFDGVVPILAMELGRHEVDCPQVLLAYRDTGRIAVVVEFGSDREAGIRGGIANQVNDDFMVDQRPTAPIFRNVAEHPMFDLVPFVGAGRKVTHVDRHARLVRELLQFHLPKPIAAGVAPAPIGRDQ